MSGETKTIVFDDQDLPPLTSSSSSSEGAEGRSRGGGGRRGSGSLPGEKRRKYTRSSRKPIVPVRKAAVQAASKSIKAKLVKFIKEKQQEQYQRLLEDSVQKHASSSHTITNSLPEIPSAESYLQSVVRANQTVKSSPFSKKSTGDEDDIQFFLDAAEHSSAAGSAAAAAATTNVRKATLFGDLDHEEQQQQQLSVPLVPEPTLEEVLAHEIETAIAQHEQTRNNDDVDDEIAASFFPKEKEELFAKQQHQGDGGDGSVIGRIGGFSNKIDDLRRFRIEEERQTRKLIQNELETRRMMEESEKQRQQQSSVELGVLGLTGQQKQILKKHRAKQVKKTYRRSFRVGKNASLGTIGVLIPNRTVRKSTTDKIRALQHAHIQDARRCLVEKGLIKIGSSAPDEVVRKMYESVKLLCGDVNNYGTQNILHNYLAESSVGSSSSSSSSSSSFSAGGNSGSSTDEHHDYSKFLSPF